MFTGWALVKTGKIKEQYINARTRPALTYLSDRDLRDIGLIQENVSKEVNLMAILKRISAFCIKLGEQRARKELSATMCLHTFKEGK